MAALITAGIFLPPVFMSSVGPLGFGIKSAAAAGALSGAVASGGLSILAGEKPKDWLKSAAIGAAMGAIGGKLQQGKFQAQAFARDASQTTIATAGEVGTQFASVTSGGVPTTGTVVNITPKYVVGSADYAKLAESYGGQIIDGKAVFGGGNYAITNKAGIATGATEKAIAGTSFGDAVTAEGIKLSGKYADAATTAAISAGVNTGMTVLKEQAYDALSEPPPVALGGSARQYYEGTRNAVANLTRNYISSGTPSGNTTAAIYASMANNLSYGTGSIDYNQHTALGLLRGIEVPTLRYT
tara:strand:- start:2821 stop:3717 length:897 start_codon:yes stop_codon:yes gene_type:complete